MSYIERRDWLFIDASQSVIREREKEKRSTDREAEMADRTLVHIYIHT